MADWRSCRRTKSEGECVLQPSLHLPRGSSEVGQDDSQGFRQEVLVVRAKTRGRRRGGIQEEPHLHRLERTGEGRLLAHRDDSVLLLPKVGDLREVCWGRGKRTKESGLGHVKFRCPWDTQGKICHLAKRAALQRRRGEDSELHLHPALAHFPRASKISVLFGLLFESCEVYFSGVDLCFVSGKAEEGEGGSVHMK